MKILAADIHHDSLKPLTYTRSVADMELGGATLHEHLERKLETELDVLTPEYLEEITEKNSELHDLDREVNPGKEGEQIIYNSAVIPTDEIQEKISVLESGEGLFFDEKFIAGKTYEAIAFADLEKFQQDLEKFYLGENSEVGENTVIDTTEGPVYIDSDTRVWPNTRIEGPTYIGAHTKIGAGQNAVIHAGNHIGDVCRVGGELEKSIINSFSNKYHYGFLGRAVVGSWVNIGAGSTNSDLKNTYGDVKVEHPVEGLVNAGLKVGATLADHTKIDIGTLIYTGKQIGPVAKISDKVLEDVEPFTWKNPGQEHEYIVEKAVEHAERMMNRREEYLPEGYVEAQKNLIQRLDEEQR